MADKNQAPNAQALAKKGNGVLVKHGNVWSYAGAQIDRSGTNLRLPEEYISDAEVKKMLADGDVVASSLGPMHEPLAVRFKGDEDAVVVNVAQAGTAEAGTELPVNSRPEHDSGTVRMTPAEAAEIAERSVHAHQAAQQAALVQAIRGGPEGAEVRKPVPESQVRHELHKK